MGAVADQMRTDAKALPRFGYVRIPARDLRRVMLRLADCVEKLESISRD